LAFEIKWWFGIFILNFLNRLYWGIRIKVFGSIRIFFLTLYSKLLREFNLAQIRISSFSLFISVFFTYLRWNWSLRIIYILIRIYYIFRPWFSHIKYLLIQKINFTYHYITIILLILTILNIILLALRFENLIWGVWYFTFLLFLFIFINFILIFS
jgi:hypothetical protein